MSAWLALCVLLAHSHVMNETSVISHIAFASCRKLNIFLNADNVTILSDMLYKQPQAQLLVWLGDIIYNEPNPLYALFSVPIAPDHMQQRWLEAREVDEYKKLLERNIPILGVWDDHDYGQNDGGKDHPIV
eukprot:g16826.t1